MNSERIRILAHIYRNHYEEWADSAYNPCGRFAAALVCKRYFHPNAEDLAAMLDRAFGPAEGFLEKDDEKPLQGLSFLCRNGHEEEVRRAFILLLGEDGGSIDDRMEKIHEFAETCNRLLEDTAPDRWELRQRLWSGLDYLALIRPEQDFFFRAPEVIAFAGYIEAEEEIGYDRFLNLVNYYRLAEDTAAELAGETELLKLVRRRLEQYGKEHALEGLEDVDSNLHLLAFDLIRAVYAMDWYSEKSAKRKSRISTVAQRRIDKMQKAAALLEERETAAMQAAKLFLEEKKAAVPELTGQKAVHKSFGEGTVVSQDGKYLTVSFEKAQKKFALPGALVNGYLSVTEEENVLAACRSLAAVQESAQKAEKELEALDVQLKMLLTL